MTKATKRTQKHFQLNSAKLKRALEFTIAEHAKNRLALQATERFVGSGIANKDVNGRLAGMQPAR